MNNALMPKLIGHRGIPLLAPENTAASITLAGEHQLEWIEVDVTMAGDGSLPMLHDLDLKRFGYPEKVLTQMNKEELKTIDAGKWFNKNFAGEPVLFLAEALQLAHKLSLNVNLELKHNPELDRDIFVRKVLEVITEQNWFHPGLLISSFDHEILRLLRKTHADLQLAALFEALPENIIQQVSDFTPQTIHCWQSGVTAEQVQAVSKHYPVYCYTVNDTVTFSRLLAMGVAGVFCDRAHADDMRQVAAGSS